MPDIFNKAVVKQWLDGIVPYIYHDGIPLINSFDLRGDWFRTSETEGSTLEYYTPLFGDALTDSDFVEFDGQDCLRFRMIDMATYFDVFSAYQYAYVLKEPVTRIPLTSNTWSYDISKFEEYDINTFKTTFNDFLFPADSSSSDTTGGTRYNNNANPIGWWINDPPRTYVSTQAHNFTIPINVTSGQVSGLKYLNPKIFWTVQQDYNSFPAEAYNWSATNENAKFVIFSRNQITGTITNTTLNGDRGSNKTIWKKDYISTLFNALGLPFTYSLEEAKNVFIDSFTDYRPISNDPFLDPLSTTGGGNGTFDKRNDAIVKDNSTITGVVGYLAEGNDMFTVYHPSDDQMQALGDYFWGNDLPTILSKWFVEPLDSIITWRRVPYVPSSFGDDSTQIIVGPNLDTGILTNIVTKQYEFYDMGSYELKEYFGSFLDYAPYTQIQLYLPFVGFIDLKPEEVVNSIMNVVYYIDNMTGAFNAQLNITKDGVQRTIYNREGKFGAEIPLTGVNYRDIIRDTINGVTKFVSGGINAMSGNYGDALSDVGSGISSIMGAKVTPQRTGGLSAEMGVFNYGRVFLLITRPNPSIPDDYGHQYGYTSNIFSKLGDLSGYTEVGSIHLDGIDCTTDERDMIDTQLKNGVIL